ncbi:hypothetical protein GCM10010967_00050 [Dyadobacter beijingensis]|uniref:Uncharacterized protein n=1 Tax=Dyadobacter beijingensis TaxID=365489 RepID=A0ABQ2HBP5_9BACT|nr:hypothetical protein [Dyadobacter beijingensis]GGM72583.1 hypothetical protein GCM10010967_00050 [Dyadobacter beijingensis]
MNFLIVAILSAILQIFTPWWVIAIVPFVILLWRPATSPGAFWTGFGGIAVPWLIYGYYQHFISDGALSDRVAKIFMLPSGLLLLLVTAMISGLVGGFSGLSGYWVRQIFRRNPIPLSARTS